MSICDNKSLKKVTIKSTATHQCSKYETVKSDSYLTSQSVHNYTASEIFRYTRYE